MFGFVDQGAADAAMRGDAKVVAEYLDANPNQLDNRTIFQSTLLHIAARNGRLQVAVELLKRGIDVNALDYGGMRRTAMHWACQGGHVRMVELLMEFGADTKIWCSHDILLEQLQVQGKSWSKLVQGRKCGQLISSDEAIEKSPAQVCANNSVRLALERPFWTPEINHMFPPRFKEMVQIVLQSLECRRGLHMPETALVQPASAAGDLAAATSRSDPAADMPCNSQCAAEDSSEAAVPERQEQAGGPPGIPQGSERSGADLDAACIAAGQEPGMARPLSWDSCQQIIALAAYPISAWL